MRGLRATIYKSPRGNFSNGGISSRCDEVTVIDSMSDTELGPFEPTDDAPAVRIVRRSIGGRPVVHLEPIERPEGKLGPMAGGCFVETSDSRFGRAIGFYGAVSLHDRFETQAEYDSLSM